MSQLFISDLDGTLLNNAARLSVFSEAQLKRLLEAGMPFTVASARSIASIRPILGDLPLRLPVIEFNGAFISDYASGRHLTCQAIPRSLLDDMIVLAGRAGIIPFVSSFDGERDRLYYTHLINEGMHWYYGDRIRCNDPRLCRIERFDGCLDEAIVCLTLVARQSDLAPLRAGIHEQFGEQIQSVLFENMYSPGWWWLTLHDASATKAHAIRRLAAEHGVSMSDVSVFGDQINDVPMFQIAGRSIAVSNAIEAIKGIAHEVIGDNESDAVVRYLEANWIRKIA